MLRPTTPHLINLVLVCTLGCALPTDLRAGSTSDDAPSTSEDTASASNPSSDSNNSDRSADTDSSEDAAPAADPERVRARRRAQAGMMTGSDAFRIQEWALDVSLEGGFGGARQHSIWLGRAQVGPMYITEPHALSLLVVGEFQTDTQFAAGGMFQYLSLHTGLFWQAGATVDLQGRPGVIASAGWQIVGFEYQRRNIGGNEYNAFLGKLRIPATWLYRAFSRKPAQQ